MSDTDRLERSHRASSSDSGAKAVAIGDAAQLPSIGAGGMFERAHPTSPPPPSSKRPPHPRPRRTARVGRPARRRPRHAMAHYHSRGQLHLQDTRDQAVEAAVAALGRSPSTTTPARSRSSATHPTRRSTGSTPAPNTSAQSAANSASSKSPCPASTTASARATGSR